MEKYDFESVTNGQRRMQLSVIKGYSYRYLWHVELELMVVNAILKKFHDVG